MIETRTSLIMRIRDPSDSASWREFTQLYGPLVRGRVCAYNIDRQDIEDVVQEVFLRLVKAVDTYNRQRGRFGTWLWQVVHSAVADHFRQKQRFQKDKEQWQERVDAAEAAAAGPPEPTWLEVQRRRAIEFAIRRVREETHPTTWMCFEEHLLKKRPSRVVAEELSLSVTAVNNSASRTLQRIREKCKEYMEDLGDE